MIRRTKIEAMIFLLLKLFVRTIKRIAIAKIITDERSKRQYDSNCFIKCMAGHKLWQKRKPKRRQQNASKCQLFLSRMNFYSKGSLAWLMQEQLIR
jgi:hypothetical protein